MAKPPGIRWRTANSVETLLERSWRYAVAREIKPGTICGSMPQTAADVVIPALRPKRWTLA